MSQGEKCNCRWLHKIRIKTKRARYAAELAHTSVGKPAGRFIKSARAVQDVLGIHQDAIQAERHIRQFLKYSTSVRAGFVAGRMAERQRLRRDTIRKGMKPLFKALLNGVRRHGTEDAVRRIDKLLLKLYITKTSANGFSPIYGLRPLHCVIFAASTSTCSMWGGSASSSEAFSISAAAICPPRCALRPASSANASKMPNVDGPNRSANQIGVAAS